MGEYSIASKSLKVNQTSKLDIDSLSKLSKHSLKAKILWKSKPRSICQTGVGI
jgi:hypothetical protein